MRWATTPHRILVLLTLTVTLPLGCDCGVEKMRAPVPFDSVQPLASSSARRPSRSYYVAHGTDHCFVFWQDSGRSSAKKSVHCPREIEPGERIRLAGRTCMRESPNPDRNLPVRCPKHILYAERDDRADAGEFRLRTED